MKKAVIVNGQFMGVYEGEDEMEILDAYAQDAGYADYDTLCREAGDADDDLELVGEIETTLDVCYDLGWDVPDPAIKYHDDPNNDFSFSFDPHENFDALADWMENTAVRVDLDDGNVEDLDNGTMFLYGHGIATAQAEKLVKSWLDS